MPTYEYICKDCCQEFEVFQSMTDDHLETCNICGGHNVERKIGTGAGFIFKGSGFYITDYRSDSYKKAAAKEKTGSSTTSTSKKSESKKSDKKKSSQTVT